MISYAGDSVSFFILIIDRLISIEITPFKQLIAVAEGRKNGNRHFVMLGQLPAVEFDGLMDEPVNLSLHALEPFKTDLASIERCRTDSQRKLIGVLDDIDQLGIAPLCEDWQLNELDEFGSYNKLSIPIPFDGAQIVDYAFEAGRNLNQEIYEESSIVAAVIYKSGGVYQLKQGIKHSSQESEQTIEFSEQATVSLKPEVRTIPLAVAICPPREATLSHQIWVIGISSSTEGSTSRANQMDYNKETLCKLTLRGWNCAKTPDQDEWTLTPLDVIPSDFEMKIGCSFDSIAETGMNARMIAVPKSIGTGSASLRLVAMLGEISKCFILDVQPDSPASNRWTYRGIEWSLPGAPSIDPHNPKNYRLKLVSRFEPLGPHESGGEPVSEHQEDEAMATDDGTGFRDSRPRVSLYCQDLAQEHLLVFE